MLTVTYMLNVVMLNVIMLSVVTPFKQRRSINADYVTFVFDGQGYNGPHIFLVILSHRDCRILYTRPASLPCQPASLVCA